MSRKNKFLEADRQIQTDKKLYRPAVDSRRKMTVRTLKDCRLVIVIFSSSCGKEEGHRREGGRKGKKERRKDEGRGRGASWL